MAIGNVQVRRSARTASLAWVIVLCLASFAIAQDHPNITRFTHSGDGWISLDSQKNQHSFIGFFRSARAGYDSAALKAIALVFDAQGEPAGTVTLRLIEYLDYIQDRLKPDGRITIISGFRAPEYNTALRNQGRLAAKASLHQYGMAADVKINGVPALTLWNFVKDSKFGGAGYYHGASVHIDVGPARSWDEASSGVGSGISDDNKLIGLISTFDAYLPGETVVLRYIRMTAFPIGIQPRMRLEAMANNAAPVALFEFTEAFGQASGAACHRFADIEAMNGITVRLPQRLEPGSYQIRSYFCGDDWPEMPAQITTPTIAVLAGP